DPNGSTLTGSGTSALDVTGTLKVDAATFAGSYASFASPTLNAGSTVEYSGSTAQAIDNTLTYVNLSTSGAGTKTLGGDTTITGDLTIGSGSTLASGNYDITLSGSWYNNSGTFTYGTGEVEFVGTGDANITGDNTFYDFTCEVAGKSLIFEADKLQDIKGILTLKGTSASKLTFKSSTTGTTNTQWKINPEGTVVTQYLDGYDSNNLGATIYDPTSLFTRCTNWMGTARPVPAPSGNTNTPQINNAIFFFNPTSAMMITSSMGGGMMMGPGGVMLSAPAYSNISVPIAAMSQSVRTAAMARAVAPAMEPEQPTRLHVETTAQPRRLFEGVSATSAMVTPEATQPEQPTRLHVETTAQPRRLSAVELFGGMNTTTTLSQTVSFDGVSATSSLVAPLAPASFDNVSMIAVLPQAPSFSGVQASSAMTVAVMPGEFKGVATVATLPQAVRVEQPTRLPVETTAKPRRLSAERLFEGVSATSAMVAPEVTRPEQPTRLPVETTAQPRRLSAERLFEGVSATSAMPEPVSHDIFSQLTGQSNVRVVFPGGQQITLTQSAGVPMGSEGKVVEPRAEQTKNKKN
ncbi:MAG: hypothetical protein PHS46_05425, partial [Candidatus Omnitrophica bacterium]|nr:hypothetical protein [Candidatus Omnitrophota bacterium]